jgi:uncharacterized protein (TIGR02301 family)
MRVWPLVAVLLTATPALAQERPPAERQILGDLAYAIGESHALRQLCEGPGNQYWRDRMLRLTQVEDADPGLDAQMRDRFNTGYAAGQAAASACGPASLRAEAAAAGRGQALARRLSSIMRKVEPPVIGGEDQAPDVP